MTPSAFEIISNPGLVLCLLGFFFFFLKWSWAVKTGSKGRILSGQGCRFKRRKKEKKKRLCFCSAEVAEQWSTVGLEPVLIPHTCAVSMWKT